MSYQWPLEPKELFAERQPQMISLGLPEADVERVRVAISDMWADAPGGWVYEWSRLAAGYADAGVHHLAFLAYGWAKFPSLADAPKRTALARQIEQYRLAAPGFPVAFERRVLQVPYRGDTTPVPVHLLSPPGLGSDAPVVIASGGLDSWKTDLHPLLVQLALRARVRVLAFDHAGTGESAVPLTADGGAEIVDGLIAEARNLGNGRVGHFGFSMGGYFAARSGLAGAVDAAAALGGPAEAGFTRENLGALVFGMADILGNCLGLDHPPLPDEAVLLMAGFSLRPLLDQDRNAPMLVVNGADDVHVPQHDTLVYQGRRATRVELVPDTGHVAASKLPQVVPMIAEWLGRQLSA